MSKSMTILKNNTTILNHNNVIEKVCILKFHIIEHLLFIVNIVSFTVKINGYSVSHSNDNTSIIVSY